MASTFALDSRLAADTVLLGDLTLSRVLLMNDSRYPWMILVPRRADKRELVDLDEGDAMELMREIRRVSSALRHSVPHDKLNVAAIGNIVPQLHVHVVARKVGDVAWPGPIWGVGIPVPYDAPKRDALSRDLRSAIGFS